MAALNIPDVAAGDNVVNSANSTNALVEAVINNLDGNNIIQGTVPIEALSKRRSFYAHTASIATLAAGSKIWSGWQIPLVDGAANTTFKFLGASAFARTIAGAGADKIDIYKNTTPIASVNASALTAGTPLLFSPASPEPTQTTDEWFIKWTYAGYTLTDVTVVLFYSLELVGE